ncbi:MAG: 30S ribosomal protein S4e [Candidatus Freyarchaeota archaeon]|nr:30S ribosomal protein S4e [Candidatus Jordarchaeia archaeon]
MGKMGQRRHLKRVAAPKYWATPRRAATWIVKPSPGPHSIGESIPLLILIRDLLKMASEAREAKKIIRQGHIKVDGVVRKDYKFPVGLMDVVEIPLLNEAYRVLPSKKWFTLVPIDGEEAEFKLCQIRNMMTVKEGNIQLALHDGRNILLRVENPKVSPHEIYPYRTRDTVKLLLENQEIVDHVRFKEGAYALITGGKMRGEQGEIIEIKRRLGRRASTVVIQKNGKLIETILDYVFPLGITQPLIKLPESGGA